jgi:hypothetical protein
VASPFPSAGRAEALLRVFNKVDRALGRYPGQFSFASLGPFFDLLLDLEEKDLNCRRTCPSRSQFLEIGIPSGVELTMVPLTPASSKASCAAALEGDEPGLTFPFGIIHLPVSREVINKT